MRGSDSSRFHSNEASWKSEPVNPEVLKTRGEWIRPRPSLEHYPRTRIGAPLSSSKSRWPWALNRKTDRHIQKTAFGLKFAV